MNEAAFTLTELNLQVKDAIRDHLPDTYWLRAETSDVRCNRNGHCYFEFVEKEASTQSIIARARGVIWANVYKLLSVYFENETGQPFTSGISVLVCVTVDFHELYGYSLTVVDIDPSFTLGEVARNRQRVLRKLEEEGVLDLNRELPFPELVTRIAVISSPTAAGYEDFCHQLDNNPYGFVFYRKLFPAIMQGDKSEASVIDALEKVFHSRGLFDVVAIIRGGGATSDLSCFDSYLLATHVAQFPLPVISGIGHERDVTVIDMVAHTRAKTPTAVAEFLISHHEKTASQLHNLQKRIVSAATSRLSKEQSDLFFLSQELVHRSSSKVQSEQNSVRRLADKVKSTSFHLQREEIILRQFKDKMGYAVSRIIQNQYHFLENRFQYVKMIAPENILKRGYTLTLKDGMIVTSAQKIEQGDVIETRFRDGLVVSSVSKVNSIDRPEIDRL